MTKVRTNVVIFRREAGDNQHLGICVNAETEYATIVDVKGNVYRTVYDAQNYLSEGSFQTDVNYSDYNSLSTSKQVFE